MSNSETPWTVTPQAPPSKVFISQAGILEWGAISFSSQLEGGLHSDSGSQYLPVPSRLPQVVPSQV